MQVSNATKHMGNIGAGLARLMFRKLCDPIAEYRQHTELRREKKRRNASIRFDAAAAVLVLVRVSYSKKSHENCLLES